MIYYTRGKPNTSNQSLKKLKLEEREQLLSTDKNNTAIQNCSHLNNKTASGYNSEINTIGDITGNKWCFD